MPSHIGPVLNRTRFVVGMAVCTFSMVRQPLPS